MSSSIYELLKNNPNLLVPNGFLPPVSCADLIEKDEIAGQNLVVGWTEARDQALAYRKYLSGLPIDEKLKIKSFVIPLKNIEDLINVMSEELKENQGIRVYLGLVPIEGGWAPRLFALPCLKDPSDNQYHDYKIDNTFPPPLLAETIINNGPEELRPCPDQCSRDNFMNYP